MNLPIKTVTVLRALKTEHPSAAAIGSATVRYLMQGHRKQQPGRWDTIGDWPTEKDARDDESDYRDWTSKHANKGWLDFRVVRETKTHKVLPNFGTERQPPGCSRNGKKNDMIKSKATNRKIGAAVRSRDVVSPLGCPFCGKLPRIKATRYHPMLRIQPLWWVRCENTLCAAQSRVATQESRTAAIMLWNKRSNTAHERPANNPKE